MEHVVYCMLDCARSCRPLMCHNQYMKIIPPCLNGSLMYCAALQGKGLTGHCGTPCPKSLGGMKANLSPVVQVLSVRTRLTALPNRRRI